MSLSFRERFIGVNVNGKEFAPSTLGAPQFTTPVDRNVFKKEKWEKKKLQKIKKEHKALLLKTFGTTKGHLNTPERSLPSKITMQF